MTQFFKSILFLFFLFFQSSVIADENNISYEINAEELENNKEEDHADKEQEEQEKDELSELEKEALAAEEAELRESGIYEEPLEE